MDVWKASGTNGRFASLSEALSVGPGDKIALAGSGGKTTLLYQLTKEQLSLNRRVLIVTTTHMELPSDYPFFQEPSIEALKALESGVAVIGRLQKGEEHKFTYPDEAFFREMEPLADLILVEADGSRRLPAKFPSRYEPVIPPDSTLILAVTGMSAVGRTFESAFHRYGLALQAGLFSGSAKNLITASHLMAVQRCAYLLPLRKKFPHSRVLPVWNQADSQEAVFLARKLLLSSGETEGLITRFPSLKD